ncbi:EF-hand domain-containing protein [Massilia sp. WF1]|uniref:EF-hand domain-containing protein n=1 Tax=Massilia sp. WF1 TaxID=1406431 RepID=UPI00068A7902|nr:EF-hand domain-containing protein [Massilia sp. WF1]
MVASISSSTVSNWADSVFSKLDTKNQGYIEKSDLQAALSKAGAAGNGKGAVNVDDTFSALDGDSDGKVTKSELTDAMSKLSDQLNAQFDASRVAHGGRGGPPPEGPPPAGQDGGNAGSAGSAGSTSSTSTDYIAAADTDGDGTVSDAEQAAYDKKLASGQADGSSSSSSDSASGGTGQAHRKDPARELAHALNLLKAYAENGGGDSTSSVSVEA